MMQIDLYVIVLELNHICLTVILVKGWEGTVNDSDCQEQQICWKSYFSSVCSDVPLLEIIVTRKWSTSLQCINHCTGFLYFSG